MAEVLEYVKLRLPELQQLDREKTVFLISVSPIEVHGPHLPTGTDVFISLELQARYAQQLQQRHPELTIVALPPLYTGSDALPVAGSLSVPAVHLRGTLLAYARGLARQGFRYLFVADNHGGPRHQMAIESAAQKAWKSWRFYLIDPFAVDFRYMCHLDPAFLKQTGLVAGTCGDDTDSHAGTNETSLMLAASPQSVEGYHEVPPSRPPRPKLGMAAGVVGALGGRRAGKDVRHLGNTLAWVSQSDMLPYMGDPSRASREAGEAMLAARAAIAMELFERALQGQRVDTRPMLWWLRILMRLP